MLAEAATAKPPPATTATAVSRDAMVMRIRFIGEITYPNFGYMCTCRAIEQLLRTHFYDQMAMADSPRDSIISRRACYCR